MGHTTRGAGPTCLGPTWKCLEVLHLGSQCLGGLTLPSTCTPLCKTYNETTCSSGCRTYYVEVDGRVSWKSTFLIFALQTRLSTSMLVSWSVFFMVLGPIKRLYRHRPQIALQESWTPWQERETSLGDIPLKAGKRMEKVNKT